MPGFIPYSRGSLMLDVVTLAMLGVLPLLLWSILSVRKKQYKRHKSIQLTISIALLVALILFEIDIRMHGWKHLAEPSPYYHTWLFPVFYVHLFFSISTTLLWTYTVISALRLTPIPPGPYPRSARHRLLGKIAAIGMTCTACTGWVFYWAAFIA